MLEVSENKKLAWTLRVVTVIVAPPLIVIANVTVCSNVWFAILLAYAPIFGGWLGLMSRPIIDATLDREDTRYGFSGKGAILGAVGAFLLVLAFTPRHVDRSTLVAVFIASGLLYYAIGKLGCLFLGCCHAIAARVVRVPLPLIEAALSLVLCLVALLAAFLPHGVRMQSLPLIALGLLVLRVYSRVARGARLVTSLLQLDSITLIILSISAIAAIF